jgi:hypothetical protein
MSDSAPEHRAKTLLDSLARAPRFAGSDEERLAREICRRELEKAGFRCRDIPFEYSQWPGRWGPPLAAAIQAATILTVSRTVNQWGPFPAVVLGSVVLTVLFLLTALAKRDWIQNLGLQRATATNLEAVRGTPRVWFCAHLDSKSQTIPMLVRIGSAVALAAVMTLAGVLLLFDLITDAASRSVWIGLETAAVVCALPSVFCWIGNKSYGALDNASGVAAVLMAAESSTASPDLGVLITSGEELGLAGARSWAAAADREIKVINCDTIDDNGAFRCMHTGPRPNVLIAATETSSRRLGFKLSTGRLIPGILADNVAFGDLGMQAVTISRGTLATLARIHTRRDNSTALTGKGVAEAAALLAASTREFS